MNADEIIVNDFIEDFYNTNFEYLRLIFENMDVLFKSCNMLLDIFGNLIFDNEFEIELEKIKPSSFVKNMMLINDFYKKLHINFQIDEVANKGILDITTNDREKVIKNKDDEAFYGGWTNYLDDGKKSIEVNNNGLVTDSSIWVHELTHYRNQDDDGRSEVGDILTETMSFTYELIYLDYLEKDYPYEAKALRIDMIMNTYSQCFVDTWNMMILFIIYDKLGNITEENFKVIFPNYAIDDSYERLIDYANTYIVDNDEITDSLLYTIATMLSIYMFMEYKKDNSFIEKIEMFNAKINNSTIEELFNIINLTNYTDDGIFNENNFKKLLESFGSYKDILFNDLVALKGIEQSMDSVKGRTCHYPK